ncbi:putative efflux protein, MATE family [Fictibacillus enclensis]|uniref:MATE family efflux transporter n=1 Tax=Fictibacillus enclensis TaxID=1017270 RepID=A0A0V8J8B4_9BACL|nr:MATE family efflux transporter [Fictibacillus enclensis]SCC12515.1 putative efflux protein, MATE family [Fictibacillus enclensis]
MNGNEALQEQPSQMTVMKPMMLFLVPLLFSNVMQSAGQLVGMVIIGRWLGVDSVAAISAFFPLFFLLISFVIGIGSGSSILIGQAFGANNEEKLKAIVGTTLTFTFLLGVVLAILGGIFTYEVLRIIGTPDNIIQVSAHYARILFWSLPVLFLYSVYTTFMRGTGDSKTPFYFLVVSTVLNIALMPVFVFGWMGFPETGVYGAAYSSLVSTVVAFIAMIFYLRKTSHPLQFDSSIASKLKINKELLKLLLKLGIPSSISMILLSISEIAVISFVNLYGSDATAAYGVVNQVASYVQMPAISLSIAVSIFAAQSIGANQMERLKLVIRSGLLLNYLLGGTIIILIYLFSRPILSLFLTNGETVDIAHSLLVITLWSYVIMGHSAILNATMRASGTVLWPTILSILPIWLVEVPLAYYLSQYTSLEIRGIWVGYPAAFIVTLALQYAYYRLSWKNKQIVRLID